MKRFLIALALLVGVVATAGIARADFEKGNWDLTLSGGGASDKDLNDTSFSLDLAPGYFISNEVEIGIRQNLAYNDGFAGATAAFVDYNFNHIGDGKLVPFVGLNIGYTYGEKIDDTWSAGPEAGVRYFLNSTTYLYGRAAYEFDLQNGIDDGGFVYGVGLGFKF